MKREHAFDILILAMLSLFVASCFTIAIYQQILHLVPLCVAYGITEVVLGSVRHRHDEEFGVDPLEPMRHRFCMLLYMHGITVSDWGVAAAILPYAILARFADDRGGAPMLAPVIVHTLGMIAMSIATVLAQPKGLPAWAPAITLIGILLFIAWGGRASVASTKP